MWFPLLARVMSPQGMRWLRHLCFNLRARTLASVSGNSLSRLWQKSPAFRQGKTLKDCDSIHLFSKPFDFSREQGPEFSQCPSGRPIVSSDDGTTNAKLFNG